MSGLCAWQRLIAQHYGGGDYAHVEELEECRDVGDSLFTFLMVETDPKEDCTDWIEAMRRIDQARSDLADLMHVFQRHAPYLTARGKAEHEAQA